MKVKQNIKYILGSSGYYGGCIEQSRVTDAEKVFLSRDMKGRQLVAWLSGEAIPTSGIPHCQDAKLTYMSWTATKRD